MERLTTFDVIKNLLYCSPRTLNSAQNLGKDAIDLPLVRPSEIQLYAEIASVLKDHEGSVLFVRVLPEESFGKWYARLQFIKPENIKPFEYQ